MLPRSATGVLTHTTMKGWHEQQNFLLTVLEDGKSDQGAAGLEEGSPPGWRWTPSLRVLTWWGKRGRGPQRERGSGVLLLLLSRSVVSDSL